MAVWGSQKSIYDLESPANFAVGTHLCLGSWSLPIFLIHPVQQFKELKSTWLRAFISSVIGFRIGLALRNHPNRLNLIWSGIPIAFLVIFFQYLPRALAQNKLLVPDYDYYLFHLKINTVLAGMPLIAGIDGALLDHFRASKYRWSNLMLWYFLY